MSKTNQQQVMNLKIREFTTDLIPPTTKTMYIKKQGGYKIAVIGKPETGKCLGYNTKIIMYDGSIKNVQDIIPGDILMGDDSTARNVLSVCTGKDSMYEITQSNGIKYIVNEPHILSLKKIGDSQKIITNIDLSVKDYLDLSRKEQEKLYGYRASVSWPYKPVDFEPYHLGAYLSSKKILNVDLAFYKYISKNNFYEKGEIPRDYMINSSVILLTFIAGVIDYSGKIENGEIMIPHFSLNFIHDIMFILNSLGMYAKVKFGDLLENPLHKIYFTPNCYIPTAIYNVIGLINHEQEKSDINIKYLGIDNYYGFTLDGNHRFLLHDFTVTHNTTIINRILFEKRHVIPAAIVQSGTEESNHNYEVECGIPPVFIYEKYDRKNVENYVKRQKLAIKYLDNPWCVSIIDDCMDDTSEFNTPLIHGFYKNGRHWKPLWIISLQYAVDIKPVIVTTTDMVFIGREANTRNRKILYEKYASIIPTYDMFCALMDKFTDDHGFLVIKNIGSSNKIEDCVFYWKPTPPPKFKFGCADYREFGEERLKPDYVPNT